MSRQTREAGAGPAGASRGRPATEAPSREQTRANIIYNGKYVRVRERNGFYNAYPISNPEIAPAELTVYAFKELKEKRNEIKADGIIWLRGPGFRIGVPPDGRVIITPNFNRKAILWDNIVKFVKRYESGNENSIHN